MLLRSLAVPFAFSAALAACGGEAPPPRTAPKAVAAAPAPPPQAPAGHLARNNVERVLRIGPVWVFRRVMREEVLKDDGQFVGWRLTALPEEWTDVDLKPGDIVTKVNGVSIVMPDDAWTAWKSVAMGKEIRLQLVRAGASREVVIPIDGEPSPEVVRAFQSDQPPPRSPKAQKGTVVIEGDESLTPDGNTVY